MVLLVTLVPAYIYIMQKRRRRKSEAPTASRDVSTNKGDGEDPPLYFQQKVELDSEQRRHEMEHVELRYEVQGQDEVHEMPGEEIDKLYGRHELKG